MKYVKQAFIIFFISFLGELLNKFIPLPIPAGVYGLVMLLAALCLGVVKLPDVENFGNFMIEVMPIMFVPGAAAVVVYYKEVLAILAPFVIVVIVSTVVVIGATGRTTQYLIRSKGKWMK